MRPPSSPARRRNGGLVLSQYGFVTGLLQFLGILEDHDGFLLVIRAFALSIFMSFYSLQLSFAYMLIAMTSEEIKLFIFY